MKRNHPIRQSAAVSAGLMAVLFLLPLAVIPPFREELAVERTESAYVPERQEAAVKKRDADCMLRVLDEGVVREMDLGTYLTGVVRAEMPASFSQEALKAQTVAARTYTLYKLQSGGNHAGAADICTDHACCQAWLAETAARSRWGDKAEDYEKKVRRAVAETDGEVVLYGGEPILAVFHSSSAGRTRGAEAVWRSSMPYLQPVDSPEDGEGVPNYYSRADFTAEAFRTRVLAALPEADLSGNVSGWLQEAVTDEAGSVETVKVGGIRVRGSEVRSMLGLRSACFTWEADGDGITFYVTGYGHGVGLSQYGAETMAAEGADYREILTHYYTGTSVGQWTV